MWRKAIHSPVTEDLPYMFATLCEYADGVCDVDYDVADFFEDMEIAGLDYTLAAILKQATERGLLAPPVMKVLHPEYENDPTG